MDNYLPQFTLAKGDPVPDFIAELDSEEQIQLSAIQAKWIVLFFYPKDDTPTCTKEACNIRDHHAQLIKEGCKVFGISPDGVKSHQRFKQKYQLPYPLIADKGSKIARAYQVWGLKKFMGRVVEGIHRSTFIIDGDKKLHQILYPVDASNHHEQILESIKNSKR